MGTGGAGRAIPDDLLGELQELVLTAVLLRQRLPGSRQPLHLPGLERLLEARSVDLLDEHLAARLALDNLPVAIQRRSRRALLAMPGSGVWPTRYYLAFAAAERENGHIRLRLMLYRLHPDGRPAEVVSGLDVVFRRTEKRWQAAGEATVFVE